MNKLKPYCPINLNIEKVIKKDGEYLTYAWFHPIPMRGDFSSDSIWTVAKTKKCSTIFVREVRKNWFLIFSWNLMINWVARNFIDIELEQKEYCQPVREVYRLIDNKDWRVIACSVLEYDDGYRYPFQDVVSLLDKGLLKQNPIKEIKRLWSIYLKRIPRTGDGLSRFQDFAQIFFIYLWFNRKLLRTITKFLQEIDLKEIALTKEDIYWSSAKGYDLKGAPITIRAHNNELAKKNYKSVE